jgi:hypothetical protein
MYCPGKWRYSSHHLIIQISVGKDPLMLRVVICRVDLPVRPLLSSTKARPYLLPFVQLQHLVSAAHAWFPTSIVTT